MARDAETTEDDQRAAGAGGISSGRGDDTGPDPASPAPGEESGSRSRRWYRLAILLTVLLVIAVVAALPFAIQSMFATLFGTIQEPIYDLETGAVRTQADAEPEVPDRTYLNIAVSNIDEASASATMTISGHRECSGECPGLNLLLLSINDSAGGQGTAPSATLEIDTAVHVFTDTVELPVSGNPSLYPFDEYELLLAIAGFSTNADGTQTPLTRADFADNLTVSIQDQVAKFVMQPPIAFPLPDVTEADDLVESVAGQRLDFRRPIYLMVLSGLLVLLIGISGALSLFTRSINDLLLGIGGLILGVWGIRSVMVPQPLPTLSLVDISLSTVILCLLIGLAVRAAIYFRHQSEITLFRRPPR